MTKETSQVNINELVAIKNRVQSFEDALSITGKTWEEPEGWPPHFIATLKAEILTEALNTDKEGNVWKPDFTNHDQWKYSVLGYDFKAGPGFSGFDYGYAHSATYVGSRLLLADSELALHAGRICPEIYNEMLK